MDFRMAMFKVLEKIISDIDITEESLSVAEGRLKLLQDFTSVFGNWF